MFSAKCVQSLPPEIKFLSEQIFFLGFIPKNRLHNIFQTRWSWRNMELYPYHIITSAVCRTFICVWYNQITSKDWGASSLTLTRPFGMDDPLRDSLTVKVGHFVCEDHILDQQGTFGSCSLQIQFVPDGMSPPRSQSIWPLFQTK